LDNDKAAVLFELDRYDESLNVINKALSIDPNDPKAHKNKSTIDQYMKSNNIG